MTASQNAHLVYSIQVLRSALDGVAFIKKKLMRLTSWLPPAPLIVFGTLSYLAHSRTCIHRHQAEMDSLFGW